MRVSDIGEQGLIRLLTDRLPRPTGETWIGDDAAVLAPAAGRPVFTTDTMVEGIDFDLGYCRGADVGWKVMAINVSDVAAMGAAPSRALTTLCLPAETEMDVVESFLEGLIEAADAYGVDLVGGDISSAAQITAGVALLGACETEPWLRSGARPGQALCVTGDLGGSRAGLEALRADPTATGPAVERHLRPRARLQEALALRDTGITAAIDISDGLVIDLDRLMRASGTGCEVDAAAIPVSAEATLDAALYGGEDFELLFTIAEHDVQAAMVAAGERGAAVTRIGLVTDGAAKIGDTQLRELRGRSWDHLRRP